ncbi:unnamed protein product, partial [Nesidiocoris tenuis]
MESNGSVSHEGPRNMKMKQFKFTLLRPTLGPVFTAPPRHRSRSMRQHVLSTFY